MVIKSYQMLLEFLICYHIFTQRTLVFVICKVCNPRMLFSLNYGKSLFQQVGWGNISIGEQLWKHAADSDLFISDLLQSCSGML